MKVIIQKTGEVKTVSLGYAVNYLLPKKLAVVATTQRLAELEQAKVSVKEQKEADTDVDRQRAERLDGKVIEFKGETVTKKKIAARLKILKTSVILAAPIRKLGEYAVGLKFGKIAAKIKVKVAA